MVTEDRFRRLFLLLMVAGISALFLAMIQGFLLTLLLAAVVAGLMRPVYLRVLRVVRGRAVVAAALTLILLIVGVFGPLTTLLGVVVQQTMQLMDSVGPALRPFVENPQRLKESLMAIPGIERFEQFIPQIVEKMVQIVGDLGSFLVNRVSAATSGTVVFLFDFAIFLYALFFFFTDGPDYLRTLQEYLPFSETDSQRLLHRFTSVTRATLRGTLLIGAIQGTINGLAFWLVGLPAPAFWGAVMIVLSVVPAVGGVIVWVPAAVWLALTHRLVRAAVLVVLCGAISGSIDNLLRPRLVGRDTKMPDLLILVSTLGGLGLFGAVGFIVGPLIAALFLTMWEILAASHRPVRLPSE
jgi:predicted PurR-regulated permease PerM